MVAAIQWPPCSQLMMTNDDGASSGRGKMPLKVITPFDVNASIAPKFGNKKPKYLQVWYHLGVLLSIDFLRNLFFVCDNHQKI